MQDLPSWVLRLIKATDLYECERELSGLQLIKDVRVKANSGKGVEVPQPLRHIWTIVNWLGPISDQPLDVHGVF